MKNNSQNTLIGLAIIVIIIVIAWAYMSMNAGSNTAVIPVSSDTSTSTGMTSSTTPAQSDHSQPTVSVSASPAPDASLPNGVVIYGVATPKSSYAQNENIPITLLVINGTDSPVTFNSPNGCQASYSIGDFKSLDHTQCTAGHTFFTIPAHQQQKLVMTHYPSVYKIPVGTYTLTASVVGGGSSSETVTITN